MVASPPRPEGGAPARAGRGVALARAGGGEGAFRKVVTRVGGDAARARGVGGARSVGGASAEQGARGGERGRRAWAELPGGGMRLTGGQTDLLEPQWSGHAFV